MRSVIPPPSADRSCRGRHKAHKRKQPTSELVGCLIWLRGHTTTASHKAKIHLKRWLREGATAGLRTIKNGEYPRISAAPARQLNAAAHSQV